MFKRRTLSSAIASGLVLAVLSSTIALPDVKAQQSRLPDIGTAGAAVMSIERERIIGDYAMRQIRGSAPLVHDPVLNEYLTDLGNRLVQKADNVRFPFEFFWVNNQEINAFAFFGGKIGVHTGLVLEADTESELASVIGHEIAHITQRHIVRNMQSQQANTPAMIAGLIGGIIMAMANPELGMATISGVTAGSAQSQINYTRLFEQEADRIGIGILAEAGFDPQGAPSFFGKLAEKYRYTSMPPEMLLTHPLSESRVADTRNRADQLPRPATTDETNFWLAKMRIIARYSEQMNEAALRSMMANADEPMASAARYGLAILQLDDGDHELAEETLSPLLLEDPHNGFLLDVQTDILLGQERYDEAYDRLAQEYIRRPNEQVVTLNLANAAIKKRDNKIAVELLRDYLNRRPDSMVALELLTDAYQALGNIAGMYETRAEIYSLMGSFRLAIEELNNAHSHTESELTKKRIQGRIEQLRAKQSQLDRL